MIFITDAQPSVTYAIVRPISCEGVKPSLSGINAPIKYPDSAKTVNRTATIATLVPSPNAKTLLSLLIGLRFIASSSSGSRHIHKSGTPSATTFINNNCIAAKGVVRHITNPAIIASISEILLGISEIRTFLILS
jgi:hypothetical protein